MLAFSTRRISGFIVDRMGVRILNKIRFVLIVAVLVSIAGIATICFNNAGYAEDAPSIEFIAASLLNQDQASAPSLECKFTIVVKKNGEEATVKTRSDYVRTPDVCFMKREDCEGLASDESTWVTKRLTEIAYDRKAQEHRILEKYFGGIGPEYPNGRIRAGRPPAMRNVSLPDPVIYIPVFSDTDIRSLIEKGKVDGKEEINGHMCWKVSVIDVNTSGVATNRFLWLDPDVGFCPRRIDAYADETLLSSAVFDDYREVASGLWFPYRLESTSDRSEVRLEHVCRVEWLKVGRSIPKDELAVHFPSGTRVLDEVLDAEYIVP